MFDLSQRKKIFIAGSLCICGILALVVFKQLHQNEPPFDFSKVRNAFDEQLWNDVGGKAGGSGI